MAIILIVKYHFFKNIESTLNKNRDVYRLTSHL